MPHLLGGQLQTHEQRALDRLRQAHFDLARQDGVATINGQRVGIPVRNAICVLQKDETTDADVFEAVKVIVKDHRGQGGVRLLDEGTRFVVKPRS